MTSGTRMTMIIRTKHMCEPPRGACGDKPRRSVPLHYPSAQSALSGSLLQCMPVTPCGLAASTRLWMVEIMPVLL